MLSVFYCHKRGHYKADCYSLKKKEKQNAQSTDSVNVVHSSDVDGDVLTACVANNIHSIADWILDTGASYHMCLHRDWFSTYEPLAGGSVTMGNDAVSLTVGIGSVRIRCHDGTVRTLTDVRHVPDLRMNLISLGTLASIGCKYSGEGNTLKITKGSLVVMRGLLKKWPLCFTWYYYHWFCWNIII